MLHSTTLLMNVPPSAVWIVLGDLAVKKRCCFRFRRTWGHDEYYRIWIVMSLNQQWKALWFDCQRIVFLSQQTSSQCLLPLSPFILTQKKTKGTNLSSNPKNERKKTILSIRLGCKPFIPGTNLLKKTHQYLTVNMYPTDTDHRKTDHRPGFLAKIVLRISLPA